MATDHTQTKLAIRQSPSCKPKGHQHLTTTLTGTVTETDQKDGCEDLLPGSTRPGTSLRLAATATRDPKGKPASPPQQKLKERRVRSFSAPDPSKMMTISDPLTPGTLQRFSLPDAVIASGRCDCHPRGSPPLQSFTVCTRDSFGLHLSTHGLVPLGIDPRRFRTLRKPPSYGGGDLSLLGLVASSVTRCPAGLGPDHSHGHAETPFLSFRPLRRMKSASPPAPACLHRLWCRSRRFPRPQRLPPPPTLPGLSPGNVHGVSCGLQGFPLT